MIETQFVVAEAYQPRSGHEALWGWFGLSYASFITLPRVLAHAMPDEWQGKMAALLEEYNDAFPGYLQMDLPSPMVSAMKDRKFTRWPGWVLNYRHPNYEAINKLRASPSSTHPNTKEI